MTIQIEFTPVMEQQLREAASTWTTPMREPLPGELQIEATALMRWALMTEGALARHRAHQKTLQRYQIDLQTTVASVLGGCGEG